MSLFDIIINIFEVLPKDIERSTQNTYIQAVLITGFFYFISRWFKAYVLRLGLFLFGSLVVYQVFQGQSFLNRFDFYAGLGILLPHIEIVELTYLIVKEKVLHIHHGTLAFLQVIARPFVWLYAKFNYLKEFYKAKQEGHSYSEFQQEQKDSSEEFKQRQYQEYQKEQSRRDENERQQQQKQREEYNQNQEHTRHKNYDEDERKRAKQEYEQKAREQAKKEEVNKHPRWDSSDPYIVLEIDRNATFDKIKKKYRQLSKMYHPDYTLTKKEKHSEIFKMISNAYEKLEKRFK